MRLSALAIAVALVSSPACAENIVIGCPLIKQYSDFQVNLMLDQARAVIGDQETNRIHNRYVSLRSECQANNNASRVLAVSTTLRNWLSQNGVDIKRFARQI